MSGNFVWNPEVTPHIEESEEECLCDECTQIRTCVWLLSLSKKKEPEKEGNLL